jgi:hypothetical protein
VLDVPGVEEVRALIRELSSANPLWGAPRIHGELLKLSLSVIQSTVASTCHAAVPLGCNHGARSSRITLGRSRPPTSSVPTVTFPLLFVLVIIAHERRRIVHVAVTAHPTAVWTSQQLRKPFLTTKRPDIWCMIATGPLPQRPTRSPT